MNADPKPGVTPDDDLRRRLDTARAGGDPRYHAKLKEQNKLFVRERLDRILDPGWWFEDGLLARHVDGNLPADAVVTLVGNIGGRPVCVIANDMTVKAGTWGYRTFQKITAMQELAGRTKIPLLYLVDSAGARIDEQRQSYAGRKAWGGLRAARPLASWDGVSTGPVRRLHHGRRQRDRLHRLAANVGDGDWREGDDGGDGRRRDARPGQRPR